MLSHALEAADLARLDPADFAAEWKWDGIRVQAASDATGRRLYSRTGDDIGQAFPDLLEALDFDAALDGELLVRREDGGIATFSDLQQRLNRKTVTPAQLRRYPAHLRAYDLLQHGPRDLRPLPFAERRAALEALARTLDPARLDLSPLLPFATWDDLARLRAAPPDPIIEGVMLKRRDSPYLPGRPKGLWWKWKRDPHTIDAVLMYAQRGHGKRSGYYSDYTFGVWTDDGDPHPRRQGLLRLHRRGARRDRPLGPRQHHRPLRPRPRRPRRPRPRPRPRGRLRGPRPLHPPPLRPRHALPPHLPPPLGQAPVRGRHPGDAGGAAAARARD